MKKSILPIIRVGLVLILAFSCSSDPHSSSTSPDPADGDSTPVHPLGVGDSTPVHPLGVGVEAGPPIDTISIQKAQRMVELFNRELNSKQKITRYVSKDIESLKNIIAYFENQGKTHVKFYFGMDKFEIAPGDSIPRLTLFFEGAKGIKDETDFSNPTLNDDNEQKVLPCNVVSPCPPPFCKGYSRYYPD